MQTTKRFSERLGTAVLVIAIALSLIASLYIAISFETVRTISSGFYGRSLLKRNRFTGELVIFDCATTGRMGGCLARKLWTNTKETGNATDNFMH